MSQVVKIALLLFITLVFSGCNKETVLLNNIDQYRTNKIISILQNHGIESSKSPNKKGNAFAITISSRYLAEATTILAATGPFTPAHPQQNPCEFKGLIASPSEERSCKKYRLEVGLEDTLGQIDGVISTEVHIVMSEKAVNRMDIEFLSSSAAIFIKHQANTNLSPFKTNIKRLVEKSIPGLTYDKVSLVLIPASPLQINTLSVKSRSNNSSALLTVILVFLLIISWIAFFFKERILKSRIVREMNILSSKRQTPSGSS